MNVDNCSFSPNLLPWPKGTVLRSNQPENPPGPKPKPSHPGGSCQYPHVRRQSNRPYWVVHSPAMGAAPIQSPSPSTVILSDSPGIIQSHTTPHMWDRRARDTTYSIFGGRRTRQGARGCSSWEGGYTRPIFWWLCVKVCHKVLVGLGKGPKCRLKLVNCRVQSRPSIQNRAWSLDPDLDSTETRTRQIHFQ